MPEYSQLQIYLPCDEENFSSIVANYINMLGYLGYAQEVIEQLMQISWPTENNGAVFTFLTPSTLTVENAGQIACAGVEILVFNQYKWIDKHENWLVLEILFEAEYIRSSANSKYTIELSHIIWCVLYTFHRFLPTSPVYLTDEMQDSEIWQSIQAGKEILSFDLAFIPHRLKEKDLQTISDNFLFVLLDEGIGLAKKERWNKPPWIV